MLVPDALSIVVEWHVRHVPSSTFATLLPVVPALLDEPQPFRNVAHANDNSIKIRNFLIFIVFLLLLGNYFFKKFPADDTSDTSLHWFCSRYFPLSSCGDGDWSCRWS